MCCKRTDAHAKTSDVLPWLQNLARLRIDKLPKTQYFEISEGFSLGEQGICVFLAFWAHMMTQLVVIIGTDGKNIAGRRSVI